MIESALSVSRGNGKSTLTAALACAALDGPLVIPRGEVVVVASSFEQAKIVFSHTPSFLRARHGRTWKTAAFGGFRIAGIKPCSLTGATGQR